MTPNRSPRPWREALSANVVLLGLASLGNDVASEMIVPLLPAFLSITLGAGPAFVGLVEGVADGASAVLKLWVGRLTDRSGHRKSWVIAGYLLSSLARPAIGLAGVPAEVLGLRVLDRVGKGARTSPRDSLLAASVPPASHATAFGFHRAMDHAGAVIGALVGAGLTASGWALQDVFLMALLPGLIPSLVLVFLRSTPEESPPSPTGAGKLHAAFPLTVAATTLTALGTLGEGMLLLRAQSLGVAVPMLPVLWAALHVVKSGVSAVSGPLADRLGRRGVLAAGWLLQASIYLALSQADALGPFLVGFLVWGVRAGLTEGAEKALIAGLAPADRRGTAFGWFHSLGGVATMLSGALLGALWQELGVEVALVTAASLSLLGLVLLGVASRETAGSTA